ILRATSEPGRMTDLGTVRMKHGVEIRGRCIDASGGPLRMVPGLQRMDDAPGSSPETDRVYTGSLDGDEPRFVIKNLEPGRYIVERIMAPVEGSDASR